MPRQQHVIAICWGLEQHGAQQIVHYQAQRKGAPAQLVSINEFETLSARKVG